MMAAMKARPEAHEQGDFDDMFRCLTETALPCTL